MVRGGIFTRTNYRTAMSRTAFKHQEEGIAFLKEKKKVILADEMGLGKSYQALVAAGDGTKAATLIVCPASLKINWEREVKMVYPEDVIQTIQSGPEQAIGYDASWIIINYDLLEKYANQLIAMKEAGQIDSAIVDEAHYIKNDKAERSKATLRVIEELEHIYMLTGTPVMNRPMELFNLLKAIEHPLSRAKTTFAKRYCGAFLKTIRLKSGKTVRFLDTTGSSHLEELREFTKDVILRRTKREVLDLPEKIISVQMCQLTKEGKKEYDNAFDDYVEFISNNPDLDRDIGNILDAKHLIELTKLKQVCSRAKLDRMVADIENAVEQDEKVIVFSQFTGTINRLVVDLAKQGIKSVMLTGQSSSEERQQAVDDFQNDSDTKVFIGNIKAAGVGITLTRASIVMFADMEWSPELHSQAEDRAHRIGQEGTVNIYYYILEDTIEEDIVDLLEQKRSIIKEIMDGPAGERWAKEMERIASLPLGEAERDAAYEKLQKEMERTASSNKSMAAAFLDRMKDKMGIN